MGWVLSHMFSRNVNACTDIFILLTLTKFQTFSNVETTTVQHKVTFPQRRRRPIVSHPNRVELNSYPPWMCVDKFMHDIPTAIHILLHANEKLCWRKLSIFKVTHTQRKGSSNEFCKEIKMIITCD